MPTSPAEIRARHERVDEWAGFPVAICEVCQTPWPCDVAILLSTIEKQQRVVEAAKKRISGSHAMGCDAFQLDKPCDCGRDELRAALAELEAKP